MPKWMIRKRFRIEYAHQLDASYTEACQTLHGHSGIVEVFIESSNLNPDGMVMDFKELVERVGGEINKFDHSLVLSGAQDSDYLRMLEKYNKNIIYLGCNPTAENMAQYLQMVCKSGLGMKVKVRIWETESGWAEYEDI